jgi:hypothetical protein
MPTRSYTCAYDGCQGTIAARDASTQSLLAVSLASAHQYTRRQRKKKILC